MRFHLEPNKRVIIVLAVLCAVGLVLAGLVHKWQAAQRAALQVQLDAKKKEAADIEASANQLPETEAQLADVQYKMSFLRASPPDDYEPQLLKELVKLASECGVKLDSFSPSEDPPGTASPIAKVRKDVAPHTYFNVAMTTKGSFHNCARLLYRMSGFEKILAVNSVQLQPSVDRATDVRMALQLTAYVVEDLDPRVMAVVAALKDVAIAEEKYKTAHQAYGTLAQLNAENLTPVKEGDTTIAEGWTITTDASTGKDTFKILATASSKESGLHDFSIDKSAKVFNETTKTAHE